MPWLTTTNAPEPSIRRVLVIPDDQEWLGIVYGCLLELTRPENWELWGDKTVDECVAIGVAIFDSFLEGEICPDP